MALSLAERMRPKTLSDLVGQAHLVGQSGPLRRVFESGEPASMLFYGPPGTGKTTVARLFADELGVSITSLSAVRAGVKEVRAILDQSAHAQGSLLSGTTYLFLDEIHRFNKAQQDLFLPYIESGDLVLIGATTENPSFHINNALLSRLRVYRFELLSDSDLLSLVDRVLTESVWGYVRFNIDFPEVERAQFVSLCQGDARHCLILLEELLSVFIHQVTGPRVVTAAHMSQALQKQPQRYDKKGDWFYDLISALHKSMRGSDPQASLYWLARLLDSGCDPEYIARRLVRFASEDIGEAEPGALALTIHAWEAYERLGAPEGECALAQAVIHCACAPKSHAVYRAWKAVQGDADRSLPVPLHLKPAPTKLMSSWGNGREYQYPHDTPEGYVAGVSYFPDDMAAQTYYQPVDRGYEQRIRERMATWARLEAVEREGR